MSRNCCDSFESVEQEMWWNNLYDRKARRLAKFKAKVAIVREAIDEAMDAYSNPCVPNSLYEGLLDELFMEESDLQDSIDDLNRWLDEYSGV